MAGKFEEIEKQQLSENGFEDAVKRMTIEQLLGFPERTYFITPQPPKA